MSGGTTAAMSDEVRVPLTQFTRKMSQYLSQIDDGPVTLTQRGEPIAVVVNIEEFKELSGLEERAEDLYWTVVALREELEWQRANRPLVSLAEVERRSHEHD